jgi:hypothetical protein
LGSHGFSTSMLVHPVVTLEDDQAFVTLTHPHLSMIRSELHGFIKPWWLPGVAILKHHLHLKWIHIIFSSSEASQSDIHFSYLSIDLSLNLVYTVYIYTHTHMILHVHSVCIDFLDVSLGFPVQTKRRCWCLRCWETRPDRRAGSWPGRVPRQDGAQWCEYWFRFTTWILWLTMVYGRYTYGLW